MKVKKVDGVRVAAIAACVPEQVIDNYEAGRELYGDELESVIKVIGVKQRRIAPHDATNLDLCIRAAEALRDRGVDFSALGGLVCVTVSPDKLMPNNSSIAHRKLSLDTAMPAFDVTMACPGYTYGLWIAAMTALSSNAPVLLLDGDTHSRFVSPYDKSVAIMFGDAGTATIVEPDTDAAPMFFDFVTDGSMGDALVIPDGGFRNMINAHSAEYSGESGSVRRGIDMVMDGMAVFNGVVKYAPSSIERVIGASGVKAEKYDFMVLHQANLMMISRIAKKFGFSGERFPTTIDRFGNVGSSSVPLTICSEFKDKIETGKCRVLLSAFGSGFSVGSVSMEIGPCVCGGVVEYKC